MSSSPWILFQILLPSSVHRSAFHGSHFIPSLLSLTHFSQAAHASPERSISPGDDLALGLWKGTVARARREAWLSFGVPSPRRTAEDGGGGTGQEEPFSCVLCFSCPGGSEPHLLPSDSENQALYGQLCSLSPSFPSTDNWA